MAEVITRHEEQTRETEALIETEFGNIVDAMEAAEATLTPIEQETLNTTPVGKPAGYSDQGYRHG